MFKMQAVGAVNMRVFVGMVKGDAELKLLHSMVKHYDLFVAQEFYLLPSYPWLVTWYY